MKKHRQSIQSIEPILRLAVLCCLAFLFTVEGMNAAGSIWSSCRGPGGGHIEAIAVDPQNPMTIYAGTYEGYLGGVYKSTDGGVTWSATQLKVAGVVTAIDIDPQNPAIIYAGSSGGVCKSIDGGGHWIKVNSGLFAEDIESLAIDLKNPTTIYAGTSRGVFKSIDGGGHWSAANSGLQDYEGSYIRIESLAIDPKNPDIVYAGTENGAGAVYKSTNGGGSWIAAEVWGYNHGVYSLAIDPQNSTILYAGMSIFWPVEEPFARGEIYRSSDSGATWSAVIIGLPGGIRALAIDPKIPSTIYAGSDDSGIYKSPDSGGSWISVSSGLGQIKHLVIDPQNAGTVYAADSSRGILKTTDGGRTWNTTNTGLSATIVGALAIDQNSTIYAGSYVGGVQRSTDSGWTWTAGSGVPATVYVRALKIDPQNPTTIYAGTDGGGVYKSTDKGRNWHDVNSGLINTNVLALAIDPQNPLILYAANWGGGISKTTDGGESWVSVNSGLSTTLVQVLAIDPQNPTTIYAGTADDGIHRSTDGGGNWSAINSGLDDYHYIADFAIDPKNSATIYAAASQRVYKSTNGGASWSFSDLPHDVQALAIDPQNPTNIYAGIVDGTSGSGVYKSTDGGASWSALGAGLPPLTIMSLAIDPKTHKIYAGTYGYGVWVYSLGCSSLAISAGGAAGCETSRRDGVIRTGYARLAVSSGVPPYGIGVFSLKQKEAIISETGIPASPPTNAARIFIDYRSGVNALPAQSKAGTVDTNTGIAIANYGSQQANVTYTLRDRNGNAIAIGNGRINAESYVACFIDQLKNDLASDFELPSDFQSRIQFGTLDISADQPLSVLALRGTTNQRGEFLITTTPVADLTKTLGYDSIYFPQFADGGGYTTSLILLNTSSLREMGKLEIMDKDGNPLTVNKVGGTADSSFSYTIPPGGVYWFQTDGSPAGVKGGWVRLTPDAGTSTPFGSGVFGFTKDLVLVSESGVPSAAATTHARVYADLSGNHNTGLAIANISNTGSNITINAFQKDGETVAGTSKPPVHLSANGHTAAFADEFVKGLPSGFTGVLDISSPVPFSALTLRSLDNERGDFLMTTFPIADANQPAPSPVVFPQIADGGGYVTEIILISAGQAAGTTVTFYDENGKPTDFGE
jgi:photosystem II stability/assembly factor-like uncharacterized protein